MVEITIKPVQTEEERRQYKQMTRYAFRQSPERSAKDEPEELGPDYAKESVKYLLYEDDTAVSSLHALEMTQQVRGNVSRMQGIAGVSTYPENRRSGYVRQLMRYALQEGKDRAQVFSTLYPFRQSFYGKFGYVNFPQARIAKFAPSNLADIQHVEYTGQVERYIIGEQIDRYHQFLQTQQQSTHGMSLFTRANDQRLEKSEQWIVFAVVNGQDRGVMVFSTTGFEKELKINRFLYLDSNAKYLLLDHIYRHTDQFSDVQLRVLAHERPETWLYDTKMQITSRDWVPSPMGRVLDVSALDGMEAGHGEIVIQVQDQYCDWNTGKWLFRSDGTLQVERTTAPTEVIMTIEGLSALVYGVYQFDDLYRHGWIDTRDHKDILLTMFTPQLPELLSTF